MFHVELTVTFIVVINDLDIRKSEVGHAGDEGVAHARPFLLRYSPFFIIYKLEDKKIQLFAEIFGQIISQEGYIIIQLAHFKDLGPSLTAFAAIGLALFLCRVLPALLDI